MLLEDDPLATAIGEALVARGQKLALSQTTSGGLVSARLLSVPGASRWFEAAIVPYSRPSKIAALGLDVEIARKYGGVSPEWVLATAEGVRRMTGADWALAESGIAGPQGSRHSPKPVGLVAIAVVGPSFSRAEELLLPGTRVEVMEQITEKCLEFLQTALA